MLFFVKSNVLIPTDFEAFLTLSTISLNSFSSKEKSGPPILLSIIKCFSITFAPSEVA